MSDTLLLMEMMMVLFIFVFISLSLLIRNMRKRMVDNYKSSSVPLFGIKQMVRQPHPRRLPSISGKIRRK